jgi:hypothetical protein
VAPAVAVESACARLAAWQADCTGQARQEGGMAASDTRAGKAPTDGAGLSAAREDDLAHRLRYFAAHPDEIDARLAELDTEHDLERALATDVAVAGLLGLGLGLAVSRKFLWLPFAFLVFGLEHALRGRGAPAAVLQRLGYRTRREIEAERHGLRALRGDYETLRHGAGAGRDRRTGPRERRHKN